LSCHFFARGDFASVNLNHQMRKSRMWVQGNVGRLLARNEPKLPVFAGWGVVVCSRSTPGRGIDIVRCQASTSSRRQVEVSAFTWTRIFYKNFVEIVDRIFYDRQQL
jgi:hypothetical protein